MKHTSLLAAAVLAAASFAPSAALRAQAPTPPTPAQMAQRLSQRYAILLGLSSTQGEAVLALLTTEETTEATLRTSRRTAHDSLTTAIKANDTSALATLSATLGQLNGQSTLAHATADAGIYALLTADQQTRFALILSQGPGHSGPGGGGPGGGPGGPPRS